MRRSRRRSRSSPRGSTSTCARSTSRTGASSVLSATHGLRKESIGHVRMSPEEGMTGLVAQTERPLFTSRADEHPRFKYFPETGEEMFRSFGGVPLLQRGRCNRRPHGADAPRVPSSTRTRSSCSRRSRGRSVSLIDVTAAPRSRRRGRSPARTARSPPRQGARPPRGARHLALDRPRHRRSRSAWTRSARRRRSAPSRARRREGRPASKRARDAAVRELGVLATQFEREPRSGDRQDLPRPRGAPPRPRARGAHPRAHRPREGAPSSARSTRPSRSTSTSSAPGRARRSARRSTTSTTCAATSSGRSGSVPARTTRARASAAASQRLQAQKATGGPAAPGDRRPRRDAHPRRDGAHLDPTPRRRRRHGARLRDLPRLDLARVARHSPRSSPSRSSSRPSPRARSSSSMRRTTAFVLPRPGPAARGG